MNAPTKSALYLCIIGSGAGIPCLTYDQLVWKPIRKENKRLGEALKEKRIFLQSLDIHDLDLNEDPETAIPKIKQWCKNKLEEGTIKDRELEISNICEGKPILTKDLVSEQGDTEFIKDDEDYEVSMFFFKKFNVKNEKINISNASELKEWCQKSLNEEISDANIELLSEIRFFCKVHIKNTIEKIIKWNNNWNITSRWKETFEAWKNINSFIELLKTQDSSITKDTKQEQGGEILQKWCTVNLNKKLTKDTEEKLIEYVKFVCSGDTPEKIKSFTE